MKKTKRGKGFAANSGGLGRSSGAKKPELIKSAGMRCAMCGRRLARAAALVQGQPVGPACAVSAGLVEARAGVVTRDSRTLDLFGGAHA